MANWRLQPWRTLLARVDRIMRLRDQLGDHVNEAEDILRPRDMPPRIFRAKKAQLIELERELPEIIEYTFLNVGKERRR
jgi:hypothetical protein